MPLPRALARETVTFQASHTEVLDLKKRARAAGMSLGNYLRTGRGLPERQAGRPGIEDLERESDWAWNKLQGAWGEARGVLPAGHSWMDEYRR